MRFDVVKSERSLLALVAIATALTAFSVDAMLPALGQIAQVLDTSEAMAQMTIGAFLLGIALGPLFAGPISDAIGRRPIMIWGLLGFVIFSLACSSATNAETLVVFRFLQALAGSAATLAGRALLADVYSGDTLAKRQSVIMVVMVIAPMIAPVIGGFIAQTWGWRWIFAFLAAIGVAPFFVSLVKFPETLTQENRHRLHLGAVLVSYFGVLRNPVAAMYLCAIACVNGLFFAYVAATPFLYIQTYGMSVQGYAWLFAVGAALAGGANFVNIFVVGRIGYRTALLVQGIIVLGVGVLAFCGAFGLFGRWAIIGAGLAFMPLLHVVTSNALTGVMDQFESRKGIASAVAMSIRFGTGMLAVALVGAFQGSVEIRYGLILFVFAALASVCAQMAVRWDKGK